ncbi:MAG TPA: MobF family relaxase, partial [Acidimicrobiales bacterium]|nr:MobF family relaxase [Acidimicrobiales bacterium]
MLGMRGVTRDRGAYYVADLARELPVAEPGRWIGSAAPSLGFAGVVEPAVLDHLLDGRTAAGMPLPRARASVAAFDLTFSAPKSVSVAFGLGGAAVAREVVAAHLAAVSGAVRYLEQHGVTAVRRAGPDRAVLSTSGMVAARFTHGLNRNGDPHLHSHVVMANLVHGADGRWGACDRRG